jgi:iron(III) transport system ATP-binding protein
MLPAEERKFAFVFQDFTLFPHLNVYKNIVIGLEHVKKSEQRLIAEELLELFEISHLKERSIDSLSGGEQQRVAIASSLAIKPGILMLDEPFSNIDRKMKEYLYTRLHEILKQYKITTILATHDHGEAFYLSDHIYVLREGKIMDNNSPGMLYMRPGNPWVASFIGDVNYLTGNELKTFFKIQSDSLCEESWYLIRPEEFHLTINNTGMEKCYIENIEFYGFYRVIIVVLPHGKKMRVKDFHQGDFMIGDHVTIHIAKKTESILLNKYNTIKEQYHENTP